MLESPTGTGKTLALLCSVLGWRSELMTNYEKLRRFERDGDSLHVRNGIPNVIYSSRTHGQIDQVVQELKRTQYNPRITVLGSREQLCVHPKISLSRGSKQNGQCRAINSASSEKKCIYRLGVRHMNDGMRNTINNHILDIEDLTKLGKEQLFCPYFHSIDSCKDSDIVFMPYNYLVDSKIRPPSLKIENSIIIIDEAHNIESVCCDSVSFDLKCNVLAESICEVQSVIDTKNFKISKNGSSIDNIKNGQNVNGQMDEKLDDFSMVSVENLLQLKEILLKLEEMIETFPLPGENNSNSNSNSNNNNNESSGVTLNGDKIFEMLKTVGIDDNSKDDLVDIANDVIRCLVSGEIDSASEKFFLEEFCKAITTIFDKTFDRDSFKVYIHSSGGNNSYNNNNNNNRNNKMKGRGSSKVLSLWCFNPGIALLNLKYKVHSMILTSGTLSPMDSFACDLMINFPIRLENPHLISNDQVYVGILSHGPRKHVLSSEYKTRNSIEYQTDFGDALVNIVRRVPDGILVFFASYAHLHSCVDTWMTRKLGRLTIYEQLSLHKRIVIEQRGGGAQRGGQENESFWSQYERALTDSEKHGAMLFAVMRGKTAEGMDFSDKYARCVVIAGIPYPYMKDPQICAKKQYMDVQCIEYKKKCFSYKGNVQLIEKAGIIKRFDGNEWYQQQAARAINQAVGRVIRHRNDYGAIILADYRFKRPLNKSNISKWLQNYIVNIDNFGILARDLKNFYQNCQNKYQRFYCNESKIGKKEENRAKRIAILADISKKLKNERFAKQDSQFDAMLEAQGFTNATNSNNIEKTSSNSNSRKNNSNTKSNVTNRKRKFVFECEVDDNKNNNSNNNGRNENGNNNGQQLGLDFDIASMMPNAKRRRITNKVNRANKDSKTSKSNGQTKQELDKKKRHAMLAKRMKTGQKCHESNHNEESNSNKKASDTKSKQGNDNKTRNGRNGKSKISNNLLTNLKRDLTDREYTVLKGVFRSMKGLSKSNDVNTFDECVVTPLISLFSNPKRRHYFSKLQRFVPQTFVEYYKENVARKHRNELINRTDPTSCESTNCSKSRNDKRNDVEKDKTNEADCKNNNNNDNDDMNKNGNICTKNREMNREKSKEKKKMNLGMKSNHSRFGGRVGRNTGFQMFCQSKMSVEENNLLKVYLKEWGAIRATQRNGEECQISQEEETRRVLVKLRDLFGQACENDLKKGSFTTFRTFVKQFEMRVPSNNIQMYRDIMSSHPLLEQFKE